MLGIKVVAFVMSLSKAVAAAVADSVVDLLSQGVLSLADIYSGKHHPDYPIGRSRLEAISVLATASIMSMASVEIIQYSCIEDVIMFSFLRGIIPGSYDPASSSGCWSITNKDLP
jgi:divalent metal cation (Fe/Co/Zn/Cd) transporter